MCGFCKLNSVNLPLGQVQFIPGVHLAQVKNIWFGDFREHILKNAILLKSC